MFLDRDGFMIRGHLFRKLWVFSATFMVALVLAGCPGEGVGRNGALADGEEAPPEVSSKPASFEFLSGANSLSSSNLKTTLTVSVIDAFGVAVENVQVKFSLPSSGDSKVVQLGSLTSGSEVVVLSEAGEATVDITAKATGNPSSEVTVKAELVGYGSITAKTLKIFVKEIPLTFTVQDLPTVMFNRGVFEFVSIQVIDPEGNSVNGVPVTIVPVSGSPLKFYDIKTTLTGTTPSDSELKSFTTEGDGIVSFNLWANASSGTAPITTNFNIRIGSSSNLAVPSEEIKIFFLNLTNIGSIDDLKSNGHDTRTLSIELEGDSEDTEYFIRWKTTLGVITGKGTTISKKLPYSEFDEDKISNATLAVSNESGTAVITASLINNLADDNDNEVVVAELSYSIKFNEATPTTLSIVTTDKSITAGAGNIFTFTGQVLDKDGVGINNITIPITVTGEVPLEVVDQVVSSTIDENKGAFRFNASAFNVAGRWTITVKADSLTNSIAIEQLSDEPSAILVNNGVQPESIFVKGTGNKENTSVEFKVLDRFGNSISDNLGIKVVISIASGPGGGEQVDPTIPTETVNGIVSANIRSGNRSGTVRIHAEIENNPTIAADTNISIAKGPLDASSINLEPEFNNIAGRHVVFIEETVTASLADSAGDAVPDGQGVTFVTKGTGNFFKAGSGNTLLGFATDTLVTALNPDPFFGFSVLTAEANGGEDVYVSTMAFLPDSSIAFAGSRGGGVKKSSSLAAGSINWVDTNGDFAWVGQILNDLKIPNNTTTVFAGSNSGLYKSTNLGSTWTSIRSEFNSNLPGFILGSLNTSTITSVAFANEYLSSSTTTDPEVLTRNPQDVDVLVGTNGEGVWYNNSRGESFSIVDADGTTTDGRAYTSATVIDGAFLTPFDIGKAPNLYYISSGGKIGFVNATGTTSAATYVCAWIVSVNTGAVVPTFAEFTATNGTGAISVNSHNFPNLNFNDKDSDGSYDLGEEIVATGYVDANFSGGWIQSGTLGTGSFIKRLYSEKSGSTNYVLAATTEGVMASIGTSSVGAVWSNIGTNGSGVFIKNALINDLYLKSDLTLYAATGEFGVYKFTGLSSIAKTPVTVSSGWSKLGTPKANDTILSNVSNTTGKDDANLSVLNASDRLFYKDVDGNGVFNGLDQIVLVPSGQVLPTTVIFGDSTIDNAATYLPVETASKFIRYVDINLDGKYSNDTDILVLDWNDNLIFDENDDDYQSINAVIEHTFGSTAYVFVATTQGGVLYAPVSNTTTWKKIDIRDTDAAAKRFYSQNGNLYICSAKKTAIIEISAISTSVIATTTSVVTARNVSVGESSAGSIDTKIRGTSTIVSTGTISPAISITPAYNQYVQNPSNTTLFNNLTETQMLQSLIDNSKLRTGTLLRVSNSTNLTLFSASAQTLFGTPSQATGSITYIGTNHIVIDTGTGTFLANDLLFQPAAINSTATVTSVTSMASLNTVTLINNLLTTLGITLTGNNQNKATQLINAGLILPAYATSTSLIDSYANATLLTLVSTTMNVNRIPITNFATEEGQMYLYFKVTIEDSNGNPPVSGTAYSIQVDEVEVDVDLTGVLADTVRTTSIDTISDTYADTVLRGPGVTQFLSSYRAGGITRDPTTAPAGMSFVDKMIVTVTVTTPTSTTTAPGNNGPGLKATAITRFRTSFTPNSGGTLIRQ